MKLGDAKPAAAARPEEMAWPEPAKTASLFDSPVPAAETLTSLPDTDEEEDILAEIEEDRQMQDESEMDEVA